MEKFNIDAIIEEREREIAECEWYEMMMMDERYLLDDSYFVGDGESVVVDDVELVDDEDWIEWD